MVGKEHLVMRHLKNRDDDQGWECKFCKEPLEYEVTSEDFLSHLIGVGVSDSELCRNVPHHIQDGLLQAFRIKRRKTTPCSTASSRVVGHNYEGVDMPYEQGTRQLPLIEGDDMPYEQGIQELPSIVTDLVGEAVKKTEELELWSCLIEEDLGAVGKSILMTHIQNRVIAIQELRRNSTVAGVVQLKELSDVRTWPENLVTALLMNNDIEEITPGHMPRCPNLSTLVLRENLKLKRIADSFFEQFHKLEVVDFSWCYCIEKLPDSISNLVNLVALLLNECSGIKHVPSLEKVTELRMLHLSGCRSITKIPEVAKRPSKLKYLDLADTGIEEMPEGLVPELCHLQVLKLRDFKHRMRVVGREVGCLKKLKSLDCIFHHVSDFNEYMKSWAQQSLSEYNFLIGNIGNNKWLFGPSKTVLMDCSTWEGHDYLALPRDVKALYIERSYAWKCLVEDFSALKATTQLRRLRLEHCDGIESLISSSSSCFSHCPPLNTLRRLTLSYLDNLSGLVRTEDGTATPTTPFPSIPTFSNLKSIHISSCGGLKKLFPPSLIPNLQNLEKIGVLYCVKLEEIFATNDKEEEEGGNISSSHPSSFVPNASFILPKLRELTLNDLPELRSIYNGAVICQSLQKIKLIDCPKLKRMPFPLLQPSLQSITTCTKEWWESVEWDNPNAKNQLQSLVVYKDHPCV